LNIPLDFERKGFDGIIIVRDGKFSGGMSHLSDMTKEEWKLIKKSMNLHLKTIGKLEKLQKNKPKNSHVKDYERQVTLRGKGIVGEID